MASIDLAIREDLLTRQAEDDREAAIALSELYQLRTLYRRTFASAEGQAVLKDLMACFHDRTKLVDGDPTRTLAEAAKEFVVLHIMGMIEGQVKTDARS